MTTLLGALGKDAVAQQKLLRTLLKAGVGCSLFNQLGLGRLGHFKDFDVLYQGFCRAVPVQSPKVFLESLAKMLPQQGLAPLQVLQNANLLTRGKPFAATAYRGVPLPVSRVALQDHVAVERLLRKRLVAQGVAARGQLFYLNEPELNKLEAAASAPVPLGAAGATSGVATAMALPVPLRGWLDLLETEQHWWFKRPVLPLRRDLPQGGSRWQWFNALHDSLKMHGASVSVLAVAPRTLIDFALYVSQQTGRFVPLRELLPNLEVLALNHYDIGLHRTEIGFLLQGLPQVRWVQWWHNPTGLQAWQDDVNIRQRLHLLSHGQVFYEFIPAEDLDAAGRLVRTYRRFYAGQLALGQEYAVVVNSLSGLLGVLTGQMVKVLALDPLQVAAKGPVVQLNGLSEGVREDGLVDAISNINSALVGQGVFVREALLGHVVAERQPIWVLEVSRPLSEIAPNVLDSMAKRLHTELDLRSAAYRNAYRGAVFKPPLVHFVPMGTMAAAFTSSPDFSHFDHSLDAAVCKRVLAAAWEQLVFEAV